MPPERDIEKMLKAAAEKRRREAGAPLELHPATRRLLHGEVARQYRRLPRPGFAGGDFLARHRWRIAWAAGLTAVLGLGLWMSQPRPTRNPAVGDVASMEKRLVERALRSARSEPAAAPALNRLTATNPAEPAMVAQTVTPPPAVEEALAEATGGRKVVNSPVARAKPGREAADSSVASFPAESPKATLAASPAFKVNGNEIASAKTDAFQRRYGGRLEEQAPAGAGGGTIQDQLRLNSPLAPAAAPVGAFAPPTDPVKLSLGYFARVPAAEPRLTLNFDRLAKDEYEAAKRAPTPTATVVLENFRLERAGDVVEIIDHDGSTYSGRIQPSPAAIVVLADGTVSRDKQEAAPESQTVNGAAPGSGAPLQMRYRQAATALAVTSEVSQASFSFQVTGTNRTLNQQVVFDGAVLFSPAGPVSAAGAAQSTGTVTATTARPELVSGQSAPAPAPLQSLRVTGKAVVGGQPAVEINALPAKR